MSHIDTSPAALRKLAKRRLDIGYKDDYWKILMALADEKEELQNSRLQFRPGESAAILNNPHGLRLLMEYIDLQYTQSEAMCGPDEIDPWPSKRWKELRERGRSIMAEDLELWDNDIRQAFGFPPAEKEVQQLESTTGLGTEQPRPSSLPLPVYYKQEQSVAFTYLREQVHKQMKPVYEALGMEQPKISDAEKQDFVESESKRNLEKMKRDSGQLMPPSDVPLPEPDWALDFAPNAKVYHAPLVQELVNEAVATEREMYQFALELAANRLDRLVLETKPGSRLRSEAIQWSIDARNAAQKGTA